MLCPDTKGANKAEIHSMFCWLSHVTQPGSVSTKRRNNPPIWTNVPYVLAVALLISSVGSYRINGQSCVLWLNKIYNKETFNNIWCNIFTCSSKWPYLVFLLHGQANSGEARKKLVGEGGHSESLGEFPWSHNMGSPWSECFQKSYIEASPGSWGLNSYLTYWKTSASPLCRIWPSENQRWQMNKR